MKFNGYSSHAIKEIKCQKHGTVRQLHRDGDDFDPEQCWFCQQPEEIIKQYMEIKND